MAESTFNNITNGRVYLNNTDLLGRVEEIKLPELKFLMRDWKGLGMFGKLKLPSGVDVLEGDAKWASFYPETFAKCMNPFVGNQWQVRSNVEIYDSQGLSREVPLVTFMTVRFESVGLGTFKPNDPVEYPSKFQCTYVKQVFDGKDVLEVDVLGNVFKINGDDMLANFRRNTGG